MRETTKISGFFFFSSLEIWRRFCIARAILYALFFPEFFIRFLGGHFLDRVLGISFFFRFGFGFVFLLSLFDDTHIRLLKLFALPAEGRG